MVGGIERDPDYLYDVLSKEFGQVLDRIGLDARDSESKRHEITLHSFRRWVYTTIEKLGDIEFANYMIGHANSTYWRETPEDRVKAFKKFEPYLTSLSYEELVAKGADIETKLEQKDKELQSVKELVAELSKKLYQAGILKKD